MERQERIYQKDPNAKQTPAIVFTATRQKLDIKKGKDLRAEDYIIKSFSPSHLLAKIEQILA